MDCAGKRRRSGRRGPEWTSARVCVQSRAFPAMGPRSVRGHCLRVYARRASRRALRYPGVAHQPARRACRARQRSAGGAPMGRALRVPGPSSENEF